VADDQRAKSRIKPHHIVAAIGVVVLAVFALVNIDDVRVDFVADTVDAPLVLVIVVCALLGFLIGWIIGRRRNDD
jgi:putative membrane protein